MITKQNVVEPMSCGVLPAFERTFDSSIGAKWLDIAVIEYLHIYCTVVGSLEQKFTLWCGEVWCVLLVLAIE